MYKWSDKKSVLTHGGRDIKAGQVVPDDVIKRMGKKRVKAFLAGGSLKKSGGSKSVNPAETERLELLEKAEAMGLKPNARTGIEKLTIIIDGETERLELLATVKESHPDTADDSDIETLKAIHESDSGK